MVHDVFGKSREYSSRALLVYLVDPFLPRNHKEMNNWHTNWMQNRDIAELLDQRGFIVDVLNWNDMSTEPEFEYELMLGMGIASGRIAKLLPDQTSKIYISTGSEKSFNNSQEMSRIHAVKKRRGYELIPRRMVRFDTENLKFFDAVVCLGNQFIADTYRPFHDHIFYLNNYAFDNLNFLERNFQEVGSNYMYMASGGQLHKGLDLLLEVFSRHPELNLFVCGPYQTEKDFMQCYKEELFNMANIHPMGWQDVNSAAFLNITRKCAFTILPSCAEGQVGSIIMGMYTGLIPVVSKACGIDAEDFGVVLPDCELHTIEKTIKSLSSNSPEWLAGKSRRVREVALKDYNRDVFRDNWNKILGQVSKNK